MISIKIKDPLFTYHSRFVNILDFKPKNDFYHELEHIYYIK